MKTDLVVAGYIFHESKVLLIHHKKLDLWLPVGDHDHCCFFYVCRANGKDIELNKNGLKDFAWFSKDGLNQYHIPNDVRAMALRAFEIIDN